MKKILFISILLSVAFGAKAQQQMVFNNFLMNKYYYNPAIAGSENVHYANIGMRAQWAGFNEAPVSLYANFYGSAKNEMKHGYGVSIVNQRSGLISNTAFYGNYAYHVKLNETLRLGMGIKPGFLQYNIKLYDALLADEGDPMLTGNVLSTGAFDLQSGLHLYNERFFAMVSMRHMFGKAIDFTGFNDGLSKHYTGIIGYNWWVNKKKNQPTLEGEEGSETTETESVPEIETDEDGNIIPPKKKKDFELMPVVMVNYVRPITPQASIMLKATLDHKYWLGLTYRTQDAVGVSLGFVIKDRLSIGYAYDYSLGNIQNFNSGSHEVMLRFQTTSKKKSLDEQDEELNNSIFDDNKGGRKKKDKE